MIGWPDVTDVEIIATDEITGDKIWTANVPAISRVTVNTFGLYVLTLDGKLLRFDTLTGSSKELTQFTPAPKKRYFSDRGAVELGYHVAVDDDKLLFVYFGDSAQLFACQLPISP